MSQGRGIASLSLLPVLFPSFHWLDVKKVVVLAVALCFCLTTALIFADQYLMVKDKGGKCKLEVFGVEKGTIPAGPFASKEEGTKALHEKCPDAAKKPEERKRTRSRK